MLEMYELKDRVALITGANSGIGKGAALRLARAGARIAAVGLDEESLREAVAEIRNEGVEAQAFAADISKADEIRQAIDAAAERFGRIDVVFANAGINGTWAPIDELDPKDWETTLGINLSGTFYTIKYSVPYLKKQGGGSVIITSSVNGTRMFSNSGATAYACSKAGQVALGQMLALELAKHKIRVNVICPGAIETPIHDKTERVDLEEAQIPVEFPEGEIPLTHGAPGSIEDTAELVLFLASDAAKHITGTPIWIDGAQSLLRG
jgi:NAD(P)-dependent dehydrogenase (short-subunit alcohol dehydrogenase family)